MKKTPVILAAGAALAVAAGTYGWLHRPVPEPLAAPAASRSSSRVSRIQNVEHALAERLKAAREISTDLTNEELKQFIAFLSKPLDDRTRENELLAINQVMDQLRVSGMACGEYATALCGLIRDPNIDPVVRDYAIQHSIQWIRDAQDEQSPAKVSEEDRKRMLDCIVSFLQQPASLHETGYGTALNVVSTLESGYPEETADIFTLCAPRIGEVAAGRESSPLANRISAIQALPALPDRDEALTLVRSMVADVPTGSPVRLVAIATLGALGDKSDLATLRQIQKDDSRVSYAARSAATRLESSLLSATR
jgi:hypothetical protein